MASLIVKPHPPVPNTRLISVTPENAGRTSVSLEVYRFPPGGCLQQATGDREACLVVLSGKASISTAYVSWTNIGKRMSVFERISPYAVYVPCKDHWKIRAITDAEIAVCTAPSKDRLYARLISSAQAEDAMRDDVNRGGGAPFILSADPSRSLFIAEGLCSGDRRPSSPPWNRVRDKLMGDSRQEIIRYYQIKPAREFAVRRDCPGDRSRHESISAANHHVVLRDQWFSAPPGFDVYYLEVAADWGTNTLAGNAINR